MSAALLMPFVHTKSAKRLSRGTVTSLQNDSSLQKDHLLPSKIYGLVVGLVLSAKLAAQQIEQLIQTEILSPSNGKRADHGGESDTDLGNRSGCPSELDSSMRLNTRPPYRFLKDPKASTLTLTFNV
ncbi:hypothetical protein [Burkholderia sp. S171]|uniref:hypothetical protein n=1 Tax=Burkholderia sp. S171 TaxID=1641860 RepID=UPI001C20A310|nr:hypothetical protein [Burkholderia sp. S171]